LLARAVVRADESQRAVLDLVGKPGLDDDAVSRIQQVIVDTGALDALEAHISELTDTAVAAIATAPIVDTARDELVALAEYVSWRTV